MASRAPAGTTVAASSGSVVGTWTSKELKILALYPKIESVGSTGSLTLEVQVGVSKGTVEFPMGVLDAKSTH